VGAPPQEHHRGSTTAAAPPRQHHRGSTTAAAPPRQHHRGSTTARAPPRQHHRGSTTAAAPPRQHHRGSTTAAAPPRQHHRGSTTARAPPRQHHRGSTTAAAPPAAWSRRAHALTHTPIVAQIRCAVIPPRMHAIVHAIVMYAGMHTHIYAQADTHIHTVDLHPQESMSRHRYISYAQTSACDVHNIEILCQHMACNMNMVTGQRHCTHDLPQGDTPCAGTGYLKIFSTGVVIAWIARHEHENGSWGVRLGERRCEGEQVVVAGFVQSWGSRERGPTFNNSHSITGS
jgi:hypothetical protein